MTRIELLDYLADQIASALSARVVKGFPSWSRPGAATPVVALQSLQDLEPTQRRLGEPLSVLDLIWSALIFATDEIQLCTLEDALIQWIADHGLVKVGTTPVNIAFKGGQRYESTSGLQQEQNGYRIYFLTHWTIAR